MNNLKLKSQLLRNFYLDLQKKDWRLEFFYTHNI